MSRDIHLASNTFGEKVVLTPDDRERNVHILGLPGMGKTKLIEHMVRQDILAGNGLCLFDIQGNLYYDLVRWLCERGFLQDDEDDCKIILINPLHNEWSVGFNPLGGPRTESMRDLTAFANGVMDSILSINDRRESEERPPLITRVLRAVLYTAIENRMSLLEARHLLSTNDPHRIRTFCTQSSQSFLNQHEWDEFNGLRERDRADWFMGPINRLNDVIGSEPLQRMVSQTDNALDFLKLMDKGYAVLVNLAYDDVQWSYQDSRLLGRLILHDITVKSRFRVRRDGEHPSPFYLYIDECYEFLTPDLAKGLAALRQFGLRFVLSHQGMFQLEDRDPVIAGSVKSLTGTKMCFRIDLDDMDEMAKRVFLDEIDLQQEKEILRHKGVVGYERETFYGGAKSVGISESKAVVTSESHGEASGAAQGAIFAVASDGTLTPSAESAITQASSSSGRSTAYARGYSVTRSYTSSWSEQLVPILADQVGGVYSLDEQYFMKGRVLTQLPKRIFCLKRPDQDLQVCYTPPLNTALPSDDRIYEEQSDYFAARSFARSFGDAVALIEDREARLRRAASCEISAEEDPDEFAPL